MTASAAFAARATRQVVALNNKLWLIAGEDGPRLSDVWSSSDGITWRRGYRNTLAFP